MKHSILYLDDNVSLTAALSDYLGMCGFRLDGAHTIEEARAKLGARNYSMVLVDVRLGDSAVGGAHFARELQDRSPWLPLMLFTSCMDADLEIEMLRRRIPVLSKPKPLAELYEVLVGFLRSKYERGPFPQAPR